MGKAGEASSSDEDDASEEINESWGKKKSQYWSGDTADLEIGQDIEDAEDEEYEARQLYKKQLSSRSKKDYFDDDSDNDGKELTVENDKNIKKDKLMNQLELLAMEGVSTTSLVQVNDLDI
jgi:U3 small nucleolar RNA-associated protein 3